MCGVVDPVLTAGLSVWMAVWHVIQTLLLAPTERLPPSGISQLCMADRRLFSHGEPSHSALGSRLSIGLGDFPSGSTADSSNTEASLESSQQEGFDNDQFVPPADPKFECPICLQVLRKPVQTRCGHRFCNACIKKWLRETGGPRCPSCNESLKETEVYPDNFARREILSLTVRCPNAKQGCAVVEELRNLTKHMQSCEYVLEPCPNQCSGIFLRKDLKDHLEKHCSKRVSPCHVCCKPVIFSQLQAHLNTDCVKQIIGCNFCDEQLARKDLGAHIKVDCPKALMECEYKPVGCPVVELRENMNSHLRDNLEMHMRLILQTVVALFQILRPVSRPSSELTRDEAEVLHDQVVAAIRPDILRMSSQPDQGDEFFPKSVAEQLDLTTVSTTSDYVSGGSTIMTSSASQPGVLVSSAVLPDFSLASQFRRTHLHPASPAVDSHGLTSSSFHTDYEESSRSTEENSKAVSGASPTGVKAVLPSVLQSEEQRCNSLPTSMTQANIGHLESQITSLVLENKKHQGTVDSQRKGLAELKSAVNMLERRLSDQISKTRDLEQASLEMVARSCRGLYIWKINNFSQRRQEAVLGTNVVLHSPGFYTSLYGYKLCIRINLNGIEGAVGRYVSLFVHFMQGEYDDIVEWPFNGKIKLEILDQSENPEFQQSISETLVSNPNLAAFQRPRSHRNHKGFGYMEFAPLGLIEGTSGSYVKNDTLIVRARVSER